MSSGPKKYVVVLAHADGWGALSANKVVQHLHEHYPDIGVHLVVSQATKDKDGQIATKLDDLKTPRELKETNLLKYFRRIDEMYDNAPTPQDIERIVSNDGAPKGLSPADRVEYYINLGRQHAQLGSPDLFTFKQLAKCYCDDGEVHYTTRGGPRGGEEVETVVAGLEKQYGHGPEVLLSVDTMAILPKDLLEKYQCFSAHPGPMDSIKIEGMQGTLRSLVNQVLYKEDGTPHSKDYQFGIGGLTGEGQAYLKGTLFMQHPELDKGPPIALRQTFICPGMCAYQSRNEVYHALTDAMLEQLPTLLDKDKRAALVAHATAEKERMDKEPHTRIPELEPEKFATWQGMALGFADPSRPWGVEVVQNEIINPQHFKNQMRRFFPGDEQAFEQSYNDIYAPALEKLAAQKKDHLRDPWARLHSGEPGITITQYDPKTGKPIAEYKNPPRRGG